MKTEKELAAVFNDSEQCFGKLFDGKADECKKCADTAQCAAWQEAEGNPKNKKNTKPNKTAAPAKEETKAAPAKKDDKKSAPAKKDEPKKDDKKSVPAGKPAANKTAPVPPKRTIEKDENGFTVGTVGAAIYKLLLAGKSTRADIEKATDTEGKSTVSTFLGDLQRAVGVYSVSRGVKVLKDDKGVLSLEGSKPAGKAKK